MEFDNHWSDQSKANILNRMHHTCIEQYFSFSFHHSIKSRNFLFIFCIVFTQRFTISFIFPFRCSVELSHSIVLIYLNKHFNTFQFLVIKKIQFQSMESIEYNNVWIIMYVFSFFHSNVIVTNEICGSKNINLNYCSERCSWIK